MSASPRRQPKTAQLNIRIDPALKEAAERYAADDSRSVTSLIEHLLRTTLREKGYLPTEAR